MDFKFNNIGNIQDINFDNLPLNRLQFNGVTVWEKSRKTGHRFGFMFINQSPSTTTYSAHIGFSDLSLINGLQYSIREETLKSGESFNFYEYEDYQREWFDFPTDGVDISTQAPKTGYNNYTVLYIRANGLSTNDVIRSFITENSGGRLYLTGDIRCLLNYYSVENSHLTNYCFYGLFEGTSIDILGLRLPNTTLAPWCYAQMFKDTTQNFGQISGTSALQLPATKMEESCYRGMFYNSAYRYIYDLPATELAPYCYGWMFKNHRYSPMKFPDILPATELAEGCYRDMFYGSKIEKSPILPAEKLADGCYTNMFRDCTKLTEVKCLTRYKSNGDEITNSFGANWLSGVTSGGTFYKNPDLNITTRGINTVPSDWTIEDYVDEPNAASLEFGDEFEYDDIWSDELIIRV